MPRTNTGLEVFGRLNTLKKYVLQTTTPGDQFLTGALAAGASSATIGATTGFTAADKVAIVGSGGSELNAIGTPATTMPLTYKAAFAQPIGARLVEMREIDLGYLEEGGVTFGGSLDLQPVNAANARVPIAYIYGNGELTASWAVRGYNNLNLASFFAMDEAETGAGTSSDPYQLAVANTAIGTHGLTFFRAQGLLVDGVTNVMVDFCGAQIQVAGNVVLGSATPTSVPTSIKFTNLVQRIW